MNLTSNREEHMVMKPAVSWWTESVCFSSQLIKYCDSVTSKMRLILVCDYSILCLIILEHLRSGNKSLITCKGYKPQASN